MLNFRESRVKSRERVESGERDVIIGLDLAAAAGVDKACASAQYSTSVIGLSDITVFTSLDLVCSFGNNTVTEIQLTLKDLCYV